MSASRPPEGPDPVSEFRTALNDVKPLAPLNRAQHARRKPDPEPRQSLADEAAALAESRAQLSAGSLWQAGVEIESEQSFLRPGLNHDVLRKLRRGHWVVQAELDLHGHTVEQAREALAVFLSHALGEKKRCVRVIHGKGHSSPKREPVLKGKVRRWLAQRDAVLAYCEAPPVAGGAGAVLALLKAARA